MKRKVPIFLCCFLWTFVAERFFFNTPVPYKNTVYLISKILCGCLIAILIEVIERLIINIKRKDERTMKVLQYSIIVFCVYSILLLFIWPGNWFGDGMLVLSSARNFEIVWLQGAAASLWYIIWLMLIPVPTFLTLLNITGISILSGWLIFEIGHNINCKCMKYMRWLFIFNPCIIYFMLYSHRSVDVGILEVLTAVWVLHKISNNETIDLFSCIMIGILTGIFPCFRNETIIISIALLLACLMSNKIQDRSSKMVLVVLPVAIIVCNHIVSAPHREQYDMAFMYKPLPYYIQQSENLRGGILKKI